MFNISHGEELMACKLLIIYEVSYNMSTPYPPSCARENKYGVYTDLSKMLGFVEDVKNYAIEPVAVASTALPVPRTGG